MMGLLGRLRANLAHLRSAVRLLRQRGFSVGSAALWHLPAAVAWRAYRRVALWVNGRLLLRPLNDARFARFQDTLPAAGELPRIYVIVMPHTLHFLLPCLALLHGAAQVVLVHNGSRGWERRLLRRRLPPTFPAFGLRALPGSSIGHGEVISLLLRHHRGNFGIVDHDCYVFDQRLLAGLDPAANECVLGLFEQHSERTGLSFPLTHFAYFNAEPLRDLMQRHGVDARQYRRAPPHVHGALARIGLGPSAYFKDYHSFHDTLHVLLAVALSEGMRVRYLQSDAAVPVIHVGGTSIGSHHTKNLMALYTHLRFLELLDDAQISARYAFLTRPLRTSAEALARRHPADPAWHTLSIGDTLMDCLRAAGAERAFSQPSGETR